MCYLPCEIIDSQTTVTAAVIWLHGLGASGHDFVPIVPRLRVAQDLGIRFVFPHAPEQAVTINQGLVMPAWYDILSLEMEREIDTAQIQASAQAVQQLIQRERDNGISSSRILLAGFSQGGAVAFEAGLTYDEPLAGIMSLSSYFATYKTLQPHPANQHIPIRVDQGSDDTIVTPLLAQRTMEHLQALGYQADFNIYPMAHEVHPQQIDDMSNWMQARLI